MRASNPFARIANLVRNSVRGEARPRVKRQFGNRPLELFEDRITPTVTALPGQFPFVPPGQNTPFTPVTDQTGNFFPQSFSTSGNTITATLTNTDSAAIYVTFAYYTAPGGGADTDGNSYDNLASQKLINSQTQLVQPGQTATFTIDVSTLKLTGQDKIQCDFFDAYDDPNGYAPTKPTNGNLNNHLMGGELFYYVPDSGNGNGSANGNGNH
jgi:hypothetical protein